MPDGCVERRPACVTLRYFELEPELPPVDGLVGLELPLELLLPVPVPLLELGSEVPLGDPPMLPEDDEPVPVDDGLLLDEESLGEVAELLLELPVEPFVMMSSVWTLRVSPDPE
jgi:hypothetical protein